ncbi:MAG: hypothetical protein O7C56_09955 [Rickettsia endosymbiont of Ixodes persulcatus]|nr:hypothetical protein [Rickettsia endosymbiont of Ixodes persulcatus]
MSNIIKANAFTKPEAALLAKKYIGKYPELINFLTQEFGGV